MWGKKGYRFFDLSQTHPIAGRIKAHKKYATTLTKNEMMDSIASFAPETLYVLLDEFVLLLLLLLLR